MFVRTRKRWFNTDTIQVPTHVVVGWKRRDRLHPTCWPTIFNRAEEAPCRKQQVLDPLAELFSTDMSWDYLEVFFRLSSFHV